MLDWFQVPEDIAVRVDIEAMEATVADILAKLGMPRDHAQQSAEVLIYADRRGIETHGVSNMLRIYVERIRSGEINVSPNWHVVREAPAVCTLDSDGAHGGVIGPVAMDMAIERAQQFGVGAVTVYNGGHYGAAAYTAQMALAHDMIGISMTAGGLQMTPTFGAERLIGLNPIGVAVPAGDEPPYIFDASMSAVAGNKIRLADRLGKGALPGWISRADGDPIMTDESIPEGFMHLPLGGTREIGSHKGMGLAMMIEILTSALAGGAAGPDRRASQAHHFLAYRIDAFTDLDLFKADMDGYLGKLRNAKPAPGHDRVFYPGLPEHEEEAERVQRGIPYHPEVIAWFKGIIAELGIADRLPQ